MTALVLVERVKVLEIRFKSEELIVLLGIQFIASFLYSTLNHYQFIIYRSLVIQRATYVDNILF